MKHWRAYLILAGLGFIGLYVSDFYFERWIHYKLSYQTQVEETVRSLVKESCLLK